jgi:hypothetical protein
MIRSITDILVEADATRDLQVITNCWNEILENKKKYPLVELKYAAEHLRDLVKKMAREDAEELKPMIDKLFNMN